MSTFTFPYWAKPALELYSLKWPDIDEDAVAELGQMIDRLAKDVHLLGLNVRVALGDLAEASESEALSAFHAGFKEFVDGPLDASTEGIGQAAVASTLAIANGITIYKGVVLATLAVNVASDLALVATGVGAAAAAAKKAALREVLELLFDELARQAAGALVQQWNNAVDDLILGPLEATARDIGRDLGGSARRVVGMALPVAQVSAGGTSLLIDEHEIIAAVAKVKRALDRVIDSAEELAGWSAGTGYTSPTAVPDPTVRIALKDAFDWTADALVGEVKAIGNDVIAQIIEILTSTYDKYIAADEELGRLAERLRDQFVVPAVAKPYVIDRSSRPKPIMVFDAPPPVITGEGYSLALEQIQVIDLPGALEPVITGAGESAARERIRKIVLPTAAAPVVTGPGESNASDGIETIHLPPTP